jgi:hypothetical protein
MAERRRQARHRRRLKVLYGESDLTATGFTTDVSRSGAFVVSTRLPRLDEMLHVRIYLDGERFLSLQGVVSRHEQLKPGRQRETVGFGVRFLPPEQLLAAVASGPAAGSGAPAIRPVAQEQVLLICATREELRHLFVTELRRGGVFVRVQSSLQRGARVTLNLQLPFVEKDFDFPASIVRRHEGQPEGLSLLFSVPLQVVETLTPYLS